MARSLRSALAPFGLALSLFTLATTAPGCAEQDDATDEAEAQASKALKARRELSFACPKKSDPIKVAFYDADSTLRVSKKNAVSATSVDDVDILPFAAKHMKAMNKSGFLVAIVSNQGGVAAGKTSYAVAEGALLTTAKKLARLGAQVSYVDFAEADDENRKPKTGMADLLDTLLQKKCGRGFDRSLSTMTGDSGYKEHVDGPHPDGRPADDFSNSDRLFAENVGIPFAEPTDAFGWRAFGVFNVLGERELVPFLDKLDARVEELRKDGDDAAADELAAEVAANRKENGLPAKK